MLKGLINFMHELKVQQYDVHNLQDGVQELINLKTKKFNDNIREVGILPVPKGVQEQKVTKVSNSIGSVALKYYPAV